VPEKMSKPRASPADFKNKDNLEFSRRKVSEIKLKRTDTTLDLSQKAKRAKEQNRRTRERGLI
jgi:hypothetical protein